MFATATNRSAPVFVAILLLSVVADTALGEPAMEKMPAPVGSPPASTPQKPNKPMLASEEDIEQALSRKGTFDFTETPLSGVAADVRDHYGVNVFLDESTFEEGSLGTDMPVTFHVSGISLRSALNLMLRPYNLTWTIDNEVLLITTNDRAETLLITKVYDVRDLVTYCDDEGHAWDDFDTLIDVISWSVEPNNWEEVGGPGQIFGDPIGQAKVLVIRQTYQCHRQIGKLLAELRALSQQKTPDEKPLVKPRRSPSKREAVPPVLGARPAASGEAPASSGSSGSGIF